MKRQTNKDLIVDSLGYRIGAYHPNVNIQIGTGNTDADILVVQPHTKMPERDSITGALKNFGMLNDAYRATSETVELGPKLIEPPILTNMAKMARAETLGPIINRYYLKELIEIIRPLVVVACGEEVVAFLKDAPIRTANKSIGKKFRVKDMPGFIFYGTLNPMEYGFARASQALKAQGKAEWTELTSIYERLKEKQEKERWTF